MSGSWNAIPLEYRTDGEFITSCCTRINYSLRSQYTGEKSVKQAAMEEELKKLRRPYPQFQIELRVCSAVLLLLVFGVIASISFQNWQHFERSGSLVVILGVFFAWRDLSGKIDGQRNRLIQEFTARLEKLEKPSGGLIRQAKNLAEADRVKGTQSEMDASLKLLKKRVLALEAFTLALGTFVWGYGALIGQLVFQFA